MFRELPPFTFQQVAFDKYGEMLTSRRNPAHHNLWNDYRPWREVKRIARDIKLDPPLAWQYVKLDRMSRLEMLPLTYSSKQMMQFCRAPQIDAFVHHIDRAAGGGGPAAIESESGVLHDESVRKRLRIKTLMDEAAESSLHEGAATTRRDAVEMLRTRTAPKTQGELMVRNNYEAMQWIKTQLGKPFSLQMLLELQAMLTLGTNPESERGRLRDHAETVRVATDHDDETIHTPPPADQLPTRIEWLCEYANATDDGRNFVHPLVKACILHFMIGFDHPFPDGNGRTARAVFYWYALKHGYDIFEYLTISEIIRRGPSKYVQAFVDCESDEGDLTYFILYKLDVIHRALKEFEKHVQHEEHRLERAKSLVRLSKSFNIRQRLLLEHALRHPDTRYTVKSHATSNDISLPSARKDLDGLAAKRFFVKSSRDKEAVYEAAPGLGEKLEKYIKD